jgi:YD repeat-containing protein
LAALAAIAAVITTSGCAVRHSVPTQPDRTADTIAGAPPTMHPHWRSRHQGGASLESGLYVRSDDDLIIDTPLPIVLRRTYNSADRHSRQFGVDATHAGEWWLYGDGDPAASWADLILDDGGRIHFVRSPESTDQAPVLRHDSTPTNFNGATLTWAAGYWRMQLLDGSSALFLDCPNPGQTCSVVERRDADGHRISYVRDSTGRLLRMESEGQSIAFAYDGDGRIVAAFDTLSRRVDYTYDDRGRLVRAAGSDGTVREYEYDEHDNLTLIREPGRSVQNWFDEASRFVRQEVRDSAEDDHPYVLTVRYVTDDGAIVESDFDEGAGVVATRYNARHYVISETLGADGPSPIVFAYCRDPVSSAVIGATLSCAGSSGPTVRAVDPSAAGDDAMKAALIRRVCAGWR